MHYTTTRVLEPTRWPLALADAKTHLRVTHTVEDSYIQSLIESATDAVEAGAGIRLRAEWGVVEISPDDCSGLQYTLTWPLRAIMDAKALIDGQWQDVPPQDICSDWEPLTGLRHVANWPSGWQKARITVVTGYGRWLVPKQGFPYTFPIIFGLDGLHGDAMHPVLPRATIDGDEYQIWDAPPRALQAVRFLLGHYYENREAVMAGSAAAELPLAANTLIHSCRPLLYG
jgi:hypothetical protein